MAAFRLSREIETDKQNLFLKITLQVVAKFIAKIIQSSEFILLVMQDTSVVFMKSVDTLTETITNSHYYM